LGSGLESHSRFLGHYLLLTKAQLPNLSIRNEEDCNQAVEQMNALIEIVGASEDHRKWSIPLSSSVWPAF